MRSHKSNWYCVSEDGLATLCADEDDAKQNAKMAERDWPRGGPYRVMQLMDAADFFSLLAECKATLEELCHLADGDQCTLIRLKRAVEKAEVFAS